MCQTCVVIPVIRCLLISFLLLNHASGLEMAKSHLFQKGGSMLFKDNYAPFSKKFFFRKPDKIKNIYQEKKILRVVTDIDDTVKSSGNKRFAGIPLGGIDAQYKRGEFYPGVFQFIYELALNGTPAGSLPLPVAVLTARAKEFLFALELKEQHPVNIKFRECGKLNGNSNWGLGPILYGSVKEWICWTRKSRRKFKNFKRLMEQDLKDLRATGYGTDYVFIGDTGEGDSKAGVKMCENFPSDVRAMFLHTVSCDEEYCQVPGDFTVNGVPILHFRTYVGAAAKAFEAGLLSSDGVQRVIRRAVHELELSRTDKSSSKWEDLDADIEYATTAMRNCDAQRIGRVFNSSRMIPL